MIPELALIKLHFDLIKLMIHMSFFILTDLPLCLLKAGLALVFPFFYLSLSVSDAGSATLSMAWPSST